MPIGALGDDSGCPHVSVQLDAGRYRGVQQAALVVVRVVRTVARNEATKEVVLEAKLLADLSA